MIDYNCNMATGLHQRSVIGQTSIRTEGSAKCSIHRNKKVVFVCSDCNELVCTTCCVSGHRNHTLEEIAEVSSQQRDKLRDFVNDTEENKLPELRKELELIEEKVTETKYNLGTVLPGQMQQRGKMCKTDIDRYICQMKSSFQEKKRVNIELLQAYKNDIQIRYECLVQMTKECKQILQSGTSVHVYDKVKEVECFKREPLSMPVLCTPEFKPGTNIPQHMEQAIGTIEACTPIYLLEATKILPRKKVISVLKRLVAFVSLLMLLLVIILYVAIALTAFYIGMNCAQKSKLVPTHYESVWFLDKKSNTKLISHDGTTTRIPRDQWKNSDISVSPKTGNLWLISEYDSAIYELTPPSFLPHARFHVDRNALSSLHVTNADNVVLGSWGFLKIFTKEGTVRHETNDPSLQHMVPGQITECPITGNLAVVRVHVMNPWMSDIAVYDRTLNVLFYYNMQGVGWNSVLSIAYDSFGNIVIGESRTQTVNMISGTGQYIKHLFDIKGELRCISIQTPCNILWAAVQQDIPMNRKEVKIKQRLLDLANPSNECKQLRQNVLKTVYKTTKDRERKCDFIQDVISFIKDEY